MQILQTKLDHLSIFEAYVFNSRDEQVDSMIHQQEFVGFDLAYLGGDFYSAIKNGLFVNPSPYLKEKYFNKLNKHGLFSSLDILDDYIEEFKKEVESESNSSFYKYLLLDITTAS